MFTAAFWKGAVERAVKTGAQVALAFIGLDGANLLSLNWTVTGVGIAGAIVASFLTSAISASTAPGQVEPNFREGATKDGNPDTDA
jgi:hypothetical protein